MNTLLLLMLSLHAAEAGPLRAGAAAVDITPTVFPVNMPGGFSENLAEIVHPSIKGYRQSFTGRRLGLKTTWLGA